MREVFLIVYGVSSGAVIATAVFAFISAIGIIPRLAQKAGAVHHIRLLETSVVLGGILGCIGVLFKPQFNIEGLFGNALLIAFGLLGGVFYGALVMSLAEVLDVIPVLMRRGKIKTGLRIIIISIALGKTTGALIFFLTPYFTS